MGVQFREDRQHWQYEFVYKKKRHRHHCLNEDGTPCANRREAEAAERRARVLAEQAPKLPAAADYTLAQALAAFLPKWKAQDDWHNKARYVDEIQEFFGAEKRMADIGTKEIADYTAHALAQLKPVWKGGPKRDATDPANARFWMTTKRTRSPATVNLYLNVLRQIINHATTVADPVTGEPAIKIAPKVPVLKLPKRKARPVPDSVLTEVLATVPAHIADAILLTLYLGFRQQEVLKLQVMQVDLDLGAIRLDAADVKDNEDDYLPIPPEAVPLLQRLVDQARARKTRYLITYRPRRTFKNATDEASCKWRPIASPKRAWETVMRRIADQFGRRWRWHDIRASFITHVAITAGPVAAQSLARHSSYETTRGYIAVADEVRRAALSHIADRPALRLVLGLGPHQKSPPANMAGKGKAAK